MKRQVFAPFLWLAIGFLLAFVTSSCACVWRAEVATDNCCEHSWIVPGLGRFSTFRDLHYHYSDGSHTGGADNSKRELYFQSLHPLSDTQVRKLSQFTSVTAASIECVYEVTPDALASLSSLHLRYLSYSHSGMSNRHLAAVASFPCLMTLRLHAANFDVSDEGVAELSAIHTLRSLSLRQFWALRGYCFASFQLVPLEYLEIATVRPSIGDLYGITNDFLDRAAFKNSLEGLTLDEVVFESSLNVSELANYTRLRTIRIRSCSRSVNLATLFDVVRCTGIIELEVSFRDISAIDISGLRGSKLVSLCLNGCRGLDARLLDTITRLPILSSLELQETDITETLLVQIACVARFSVLDIRGSKSISRATIETLKRVRPSLLVLL